MADDDFDDDRPGKLREPRDDNVRWLRPGKPHDSAKNQASGLGSSDDGTGADSDPPPPIRPGRIRGVRTFLELDTNPHRTPRAPGVDRLSILRAHHPTVAFYRFLYHTVGEKWLWYERRAMSDTELADLIRDPAIHIYVLYNAGVPAGFVELNQTDPAEIKIEYFGLMPDFIGQRLGPYFLDWAIAKGFSSEPERLVLNTSSLDHPKAIGTYQRAGFIPVAQEHFEIDDPRLDPALGFPSA